MSTYVTIDATGCAAEGMGIVHYQGPSKERAVAVRDERLAIYRNPLDAEVGVFEMVRVA